ncbi:AIG2-like family protein [Lyngbya aestuarii BL J]|uniref:AIG2-like family protein n=2 Tax=Lyngbya aestuarii TaxID=118322 RepID=U7QJ77_9CYAN|nr:AIG2-like family protein [Lyngbya aestuarii BL J]
MSLNSKLRLTNQLEFCAQTKSQLSPTEEMFYYFAYGSCMCPVDLQRTMGELTYQYVMGPAILQGYRLGFYRRSQRRNCGVLDIVKDPNSAVEGVLYQLPQRMSDLLDEREEVRFDTHQGIHIGGYQPERIEVFYLNQLYTNVRTYTVINKLPEELAPNDWYFNVVLRGAVTCGLTQEYCWKLFEHMHKLQQKQIQISSPLLRSA